MQLKVVPQRTYCTLTGESKTAVDARIKRGIWRQGTHWHKVAGVKERWIDLEAIAKWARSGGLE